MIVEGQTRGRLAQGIGDALLESLHYDSAGQPLTIRFKDYLMPISETIPDIVYEHFETPASHIPGGFKGARRGHDHCHGRDRFRAGPARPGDLAPSALERSVAVPRVWDALQQAALE